MNADVVIIGGGPAGMMAAITASRRGKNVTLVEKNPEPGRKLLITGGGRCNMTNLCEVDEFLEHVHGNREFLYSALYTLSPSSLVQMLEDSGLATKVESGNRVFPERDDSRVVLHILRKLLDDGDVNLVHGTGKGIRTMDGKVHSIVLEDGRTLECSSLVLATGGITYPETGSTGDGYEIARLAGHRIVPPIPCLRPMICRDDLLRGLKGISLHDVGMIGPGNETARGPLMITHNGISGPVVFDMDIQIEARHPYELALDLFPGYNSPEVDDLLLETMLKEPKKMISNVLASRFGKRFSERVMEKVGIPRGTTSSQLKKAMRKDLVNFMVSIPLHVTGADDRVGMVTSGGVDTTEIDPSTMSSKKIQGLFLAGELIDIHAGTGGYNLHLAWSTGYLAGDNC